MASFPNLSSGRVAKYPLTRRKKYRTGVFIANDLSEQRFSRGSGGLEEFELAFDNVTTADKDLVRAFFNARRGPFDTTWSLTLQDGYNREQDAMAAAGEKTTWQHLQFTPGQTFEARQIKPGRWAFRLRARQTRLG